MYYNYKNQFYDNNTPTPSNPFASQHPHVLFKWRIGKPPIPKLMTL